MRVLTSIFLFVLMHSAVTAQVGSVRPQSGGSSGTSTAVRSTIDNHILKEGDEISFSIRTDPYFNSEPPHRIPVNNYEMRFPVTHDPDHRGLYVTLNAAGKSVAQVRREVSSLLLQDYYNRVEVDIFIEDKAARLGKVTVFDKGGLIIDREFDIDLEDPPRLTELLTKASDNFKDTRFLDPDKVRLIRVTNGQTTFRELPWSEIKRSGKQSDDPVLQDGDRIQIRERNTFGGW